MSAARNHRRTARIRAFATSTGFTYQQALQYLDHFDAYNTGPDDNGDEIKVVLTREVRVGDYLFMDSDSNSWGTDSGMRITRMTVTDDDVTMTTSTLGEIELDAHSQLLILRLAPAEDPDVNEDDGRGFAVVQPPRLINSHLHITDTHTPSAVLRQLLAKPPTARPEPTLLPTRALMPSKLLVRSNKLGASQLNEATGQRPTLADIHAAANAARNTIDAGKPVRAHADYINVWVPDHALVIDEDHVLAVNPAAEVSDHPEPGYMNHLETLYTPALGYYHQLDLFGPPRKWRRQPLSFTWNPRDMTMVIDRTTTHEYLLISVACDRTTPDGQPGEYDVWNIPHPIPWW